MTEQAETTNNKRKIWIRGFYMLLMMMIFQLVGTVILAVTIFQFVMILLTDEPVSRLLPFSRSLANYLQQMVHFLNFTTEEIPFPFSDWPKVED